VDETRAPVRLVPAARGATVTALIDGVMEGKAFVALTGPAGIGKTTAAAAIRDELVRRSVRVLQIRRGDNASISLRTIASQILGTPEAELNDDDIERLFDVMTMREVLDQRYALIIDDAECLQADALGYLRLLSILAKDAMPQVVFVGGSEFWDTEYAVRSDLRALITAHWELARLSPDETREFVEQFVASSGAATDIVFAPGGLEALVRQGDGLCGRIVALVSLARTLQAERQDHWLTSTLIDDAAAKLDAGETGPFEAADRPPCQDGGDANCGTSAPAPEALPELDVAAAPADRRIVGTPSLWVRRVGRVAGVALVLFAIATAATWQTWVHFPRTDARTTGGVAGTGVAAVPDRAATNVVASNVVLPDLLDQAASQAAPVEAGVDGRSARSLPASSPATSIPASTQAANSEAGPLASDQPDRPVSVVPGTMTMPEATVPAVALVAMATAPADAANMEAEPTDIEQPTVPPPAPASAVPVSAAEPGPPVAGAGVTPDDEAAGPVPQDNPAMNSPAPVVTTTEAPAAPADPVIAAKPAQPAAGAGVTPADEAARPVSQDNPAVNSPTPVVTTTDAPATPAIVAPAPPSAAAETKPQEVAAPAAADVAPKGSDVATLAPASGDAVSSGAAAAPRPEPPKPTPAAPASSRFASSDLTLLLSRGDTMLALGDISAARLLYQRAAALGSGRAATAVGKTYDPAFLASIRASGIAADRVVAATWYRKGAGLGDLEGADRLAGLGRTQ
jgi:type II secretory pathway predicted ATPase ExeA